VVGDVSGKGVPAALFMAVTKTMIKTRAMDDPSPASIITRVNDEMSEDNPSSMFVTLFIAICNLNSGECRFTNAGHNPPYILRKSGKLEVLNQRHGPIIGALEGLAYKEDLTQLEKDDQLLIFTDGVTEAMDPACSLYTERRLEEFLDGMEFSSVEELVARSLDSVEEFASGADQADDITLLAFSLDKEPGSSDQREMSLVIAPEFQEIDRLNRELAYFAEENNLPAAVTQKLNIAMDELVNNIISYGLDEHHEHSIEINCSCSQNVLEIEVIDGGKPFNPFENLDADTTSSIDDREIGGLGRLLVMELMDEVDYERRLGKNVVKLIMNI
jgi:sigma-B regulation protein RsbU (phosphoserine phosphatase)